MTGNDAVIKHIQYLLAFGLQKNDNNSLLATTLQLKWLFPIKWAIQFTFFILSYQISASQGGLQIRQQRFDPAPCKG